MGAPFGYRKSLERIRRMRNVNIYNFRQLHLEPLKNAMLSPIKTFDWLFSRNYVFFIKLNLTLKIVFDGFCNIIMFQSEWTNEKLSFIDLNKSIKSLYIKSWNVLDAFVYPFLVLTTSFTLGGNRLNHWNYHWIIFVETSISNTLSTAKFIWNFPLRPERKINLR